jgi:ABC-type nickel/cobalt efflux system permease component RcnA
VASFTDLPQQGAGHAWLFIPSAILLGVLHGLEPGHSTVPSGDHRPAALPATERTRPRRDHGDGVLGRVAITLVAVGSMTALSVRHATRRWTWLATAARRAPYAFGALIILVGVYVGVQGWLHLSAAPFS